MGETLIAGEMVGHAPQQVDCSERERVCGVTGCKRNVLGSKKKMASNYGMIFAGASVLMDWVGRQ